MMLCTSTCPTDVLTCSDPCRQASAARATPRPNCPQPKVLKGAGLDFQSLLLSAFVFVHSYILLHSYGVLDKEHCFCAVQG